MRLRTRVWRAHHPRWAWAADSGEGAAIHGGRFDPQGVAALYTARDELTAIAEAQQGFAIKAQPMTLIAYDVDCEDILDLTDAETCRRHGMSAELLSSPWRSEWTAQGEPRLWTEVRRLSAGHAGIIVPSYAPAARGANVVFWRWSRDRPHRVVPIDDHGRLPAPP